MVLFCAFKRFSKMRKLSAPNRVESVTYGLFKGSENDLSSNKTSKEELIWIILSTFSVMLYYSSPILGSTFH